MPGGLDAFLNFLVPLIIFVFFGVMLWRAFKDEIKAFIEWCKENFGDKSQDHRDEGGPYGTSYQIEYR